MTAPRPKILTAFTVPTGGWTFTIYVDNVGSFDEDIDVSIAAGDYFMSGDNQDDDFLQALMAALYAALDADASSADYNTSTAEGKPFFWIDSSHKVNINVDSDHEMRFAWTEEDGASIAAVLGFDSSSDSDFTGTTIVGDYHHAYGWYADEDGYLKDDSAEDIDHADTNQSVTPGGYSRAIYQGSTFRNFLSLDMVKGSKTFSANTGYTSAPTYPYNRNEPLQCWWIEARQGVRFRVYQYNQVDPTLAEHRGTATGGGTAQMIDVGKSWSTEPYELLGKVLQMNDFTDDGDPMRWHITAHSPTAVNGENGVNALAMNTNGTSYAIFDERYGTYVVDIRKMKKFEPKPFKKIDRYSITIPLIKYV